MNRRDEFLLEMYRQMFGDINRNITVIWQAVGVLIGAFAILALVEKDIVSLDIAGAILVLICAWLLAHVIDSSYWYNRNLVIVANIERQFLDRSDLRDIHYYFGKHRKNNKMIKQLRIQYWLGLGLACVVLYYHFSERVLDGLSSPWSAFEPARALPYLSAIACIAYCVSLTKDRHEAFRAFVDNSPGVSIDTTGIDYGVGHSYGEGAWKKLRRRLIEWSTRVRKRFG